jgi:hypothetical protein
MKKRIFIAIFVVICMSLLVVAASAEVPIPPKPTLDVDFGTVTTIDGFTPPSELYVSTDERVLLVDEEGNYVTYPSYYITKDSATFDVNFNSLNSATGKSYSKASVAMLEIPEGVTPIPNNTFQGTAYTVCVYVQFPSTITTFGNNVFNTNKACRIVEFVDGKEPLAIGDGMFSGAWNGGTVVEYVKFPNNAVSIGNNTFGKTLTNKTIIFGENLASIGTGFFGETTPRDKDTFIYASDKFFADTSKVFANLFGNHGPWHNNHLRLTIFYTGTMEQAKALSDACAALQTGYVFNNATFVSASEYDYTTHKPSKDLSATIIYDCNNCDVFYNGVHKYDDSNPCVKACLNCGLGTKSHADKDAELVSIAYANGYSNPGEKHTTCSNEGCPLNLKEAVKPLFETNGYSIPESGKGGIAISFIINYDEINAFEKATGKSITKYGAFAIAYNNIGSTDIMNNDKAICVDIEKGAYASFEMRISGFETDNHKEAKISFGAYVIDENGTVSYLQPGVPNEGDKYCYTTYNTILNQAS